MREPWRLGRLRFSTPEPPNIPQTTAAPRKTDAQVQEEARQARLDAQRKRGRRRTMLTKDEVGEPTSAASAGAPGSATTIG